MLSFSLSVFLSDIHVYEILNLSVTEPENKNFSVILGALNMSEVVL